MSLITRCPACGTMFNVVTDQLKVSQGWVRCGQCADVFDAKIHLQAENTPSPSQLLPISTDEPWPSAMASTGSGYVSYAEEVTAALNTPDENAALAAVDAPSPVLTPASEGSEPVFVDTLDTFSSDIPSDVSNDVSFVRDARRQAFWRKPLIRLVLGLSALLLLGLLALQAAVEPKSSVQHRGREHEDEGHQHLAEREPEGGVAGLEGVGPGHARPGIGGDRHRRRDVGQHAVVEHEEMRHERVDP
eukprot:gene57318-78535_t